jgi:CHAT domain-containing protein/tetratricopeptide (TPR) repeat protein
MNEQRQQDYLNLIQELLTCPNGEEVNILNAHLHLIDGDLVQVMAQVAEMMAQQGDKNTAKFLTDWAQQITAYLDNSSSATSPEEYIKFLREVLQATAESNGNAQVVYPILSANQDKLNDVLVEIYANWASNFLLQVEPAQARNIAVVFVNFSALIASFTLGNIVFNLEIAIRGYELVFNIFTRDDFPQDWARTQNNLGNAYRDRLRGDKSENLEKAITCYELALQVRKQDDFPQDWARTQSNLGTAYNNRLRGDKAENWEKAITYYELALLECTRDKSPQDWARTQNNLGNAYRDRLRGDKAENLEKAITCYELALQVRKRDKSPQDWARTQNNLGNAYRDRVRGDKAENLETGIHCYELALLEGTRDKFPQDWARTQNNLGITYRDRLKGDKSDNLEKAIVCCELALLEYNSDNFPQYWAMTQCHLVLAYIDRIKGDKAENLEKAITCYELALQVRKQDKFRQDWAVTHNHLGQAYRDKFKGDKAENLEKAITCYEVALLGYTRDKFPYEWASTQNNLGNAYSERLKGDKAENLEKAIACYELALLEGTCDKFPQEWAATQNSLGNAYSERLKGDRAENLEKAIACHELALRERNRDKFPQHWAATQNNLGTAYSDRIKGDKAENLEKAIACYELALLECTCDKFPQEWVATQNNLGNAYNQRLRGDKAENLEQAIACHKLALRERNRDRFPQHWAATQNNLGIAYSNRIKGDKAENLEQAIACWRSALEIYTPTAFSIDCLRTGRILGNAAFTAGKWEIAIEGYKQAIDAVEESRTQAMSDDRRQEIIAEAVGVYSNIVQAYINLGQINKAIEYADRSRSKRLVDLMASNDLYAGGEIPPQVQEYLQQYDQLQAQIDAERERLRRESDSSKQQTDKGTVALTRAGLEAATATIADLEAQKQQIWEQMRRLDPVLAGEVQVTPLDFATIQQLIDQSQTTILNFFTTNNDTHIFIIYKDKAPQLHTCTGFGYQALRDLVVNQWLNPYLDKKNDGGIWYAKISEFLQKLAEKLQLTTLVKNHLTEIEELIIIPHLFWHQIPFSALPLTIPTQVNSQPPDNQSSGMIRQVIETFTRLGGGKKTISGTLPTDTETGLEIVSTQYLGDKFRIRYVPSSQILQYCQQRPQLSQITYGTVENADGTLPNAEFECEQIANLCNIPANQRLKGRDQATVSNYPRIAKQVQVLHSSHHASSRLDSPLESVLILADGKITLGQIMSPGFRLPNLSDVFLSCCETNLGVAGITDDILSLSTGFLCAGARSVVSTLWSVDDLATALFSIFYYQYRQGGLNRTESLRKAQVQLRTLSGKILADEYKGELETHLQQQGQQAMEKWEKAKKNRKRLFEGTPEYQRWDEEYKHWNAIASRIFKVKENLKILCGQELPFAEPYYWAGFICSGLS